MISSRLLPVSASTAGPRARLLGALRGVLLCGLLLSGCGMKGPLSLPPPAQDANAEKAERK